MKATKMTFVAMMMTAVVVLMGCQPAVDPLPEPVKVTIADTFVNVENTSESITGVYYWDDEPGVYFTSGDVELLDRENADGVFTVTADGITTYFNQKWFVGYFTSSAGGYEGNWTFVNDNLPSDPDSDADNEVSILKDGLLTVLYPYIGGFVEGAILTSGTYYP